MKIVIEIHEKEYQSILNSGQVPYGVVYAIMNGTPLPKGHGDLIDRDDLKSEIIECTEINLVDWRDIENATVIIEADKEG